MDTDYLLMMAKALQGEANKLRLPPEEGLGFSSDSVVPLSYVKQTRGYIERVIIQINACYDSGCYDACLVMIRKLIEILIIECYEYYAIESEIKDPDGYYYSLTRLVDSALTCNHWTIGKTAKKALPDFRMVGHDSAHNRRTIAHRNDVDRIVRGLRAIVQEFVILADLTRENT